MVSWALCSALAIPAGATNTAHTAATEVTKVAKVVKALVGRTLRPLSVLDCFTQYIAAGIRFVATAFVASAPLWRIRRYRHRPALPSRPTTAKREAEANRHAQHDAGRPVDRHHDPAPRLSRERRPHRHHRDGRRSLPHDHLQGTR